jgi:glc operon protein GlcG
LIVAKSIVGVVLSMLLMPSLAYLQSARAQLLEKKALSLQAARKMVAAAEAEAERNHWRGAVAIVDDGGWLILLERMDDPASVELAAGKARSAALFKKSTQALEEAIDHGRYAAITARGFVEMQGGLPVVVARIPWLPGFPDRARRALLQRLLAPPNLPQYI